MIALIGYSFYCRYKRDIRQASLFQWFLALRYVTLIPIVVLGAFGIMRFGELYALPILIAILFIATAIFGVYYYRWMRDYWKLDSDRKWRPGSKPIQRVGGERIKGFDRKGIFPVAAGGRLGAHGEDTYKADEYPLMNMNDTESHPPRERRGPSPDSDEFYTSDNPTTAVDPPFVDDPLAADDIPASDEIPITDDTPTPGDYRDEELDALIAAGMLKQARRRLFELMQIAIMINDDKVIANLRQYERRIDAAINEAPHSFDE